MLASIWFLYSGSKAELSPPEDQGVMVISGQVGANATLDQMQLYNRQILDILSGPKEARGYWHTMSPPSYDDGLVLKPWSQRHRSTATVAAEVQQALSHVAGSEMAVYVPPYLPGSWGLPVSFVIEGTGNVAALNTVSDAFLARVRSSGLFAYAEKDLKIDQPQATIVVDRDKLSTLGITMSDVGNTLNAMLGDSYVGFFSSGQRSYKVEPLVGRQFRLNPSQILDYPIATVSGISVPLSSVASIRRSVVPESIAHFQQLDATTVSAVPMPGVTQAQAYAYLQKLSRETLPSGYGIDTVGSLRQFVQESGGFATTFALAIVVTYLALAALFESLLDPLIILVSVPMSIAGALLFVWLGVGGASLNLFTEVGLVTLMGLISKHGILIVEVANEQQALGLSKREAIERACLLRLRPILMTTAAMVLGVLPLVFATGAGAASRYVMGLVIASGLSIGTLFTLFVLPAVYMLIAGRHGARQHAPGRAAREHAIELGGGSVRPLRSAGTLPPFSASLVHDRLVQPDVHRGAVVGVAGIAQLVGEIGARLQAAVEIEQLHQVDDRGLPVQLLRVLGCHLGQDGGHVDRRRRSGRGDRRGGRGRRRDAVRDSSGGDGTRRGRGTGCAVGGGIGGGRLRRRGRGRMAEDLGHDRAENAHGVACSHCARRRSARRCRYDAGGGKVALVRAGSRRAHSSPPDSENGSTRSRL